MVKKLGKKKQTVNKKVQFISLALFSLAGILIILLFFFKERSFDKNKAYQHVKNIVSFGPRPSGSKALVRTEDYIKKCLKGSGFLTKEDSFVSETPEGKITMKNITGILKGKTNEIIIISAHYESKKFSRFPFLGAVDNASGTGLLLEIADVLSKKMHKKTYWLTFFDGEEAFKSWSAFDSKYGSRRYVEMLIKEGDIRNVSSMILLDMVGEENIRINNDLNSSLWLRQIMFKAADELGLNQFFTGTQTGVDDDHIPFLQAGIPSIDIIDLNYKYWHTQYDTLERISVESLDVIGRVTLKMIDRLDE